jgi:hypothetical protein
MLHHIVLFIRRLVDNMKTVTLCVQCGPSRFVFDVQNVNSTGIYESKCKQGHDIINVCQNEHYEMLFDMGIDCLLNENYRDSLTNICASVERFYQWCIFTFSLSQQIDYALIESTWKLMSTQSERQLGAFYALYLNFFSEKPRFIDYKYVKLRNDVTHKGYIPTRDQAYEYAQAIFNYIQEIMKKILTQYSEQVKLVSITRLRSLYSGITEKKRGFASTLFIPTCLSLVNSDPQKIVGFDDAIKQFKVNNRSTEDILNLMK